MAVLIFSRMSESEDLMRKLLLLTFLLTTTSWAQDFADDQYPEMDPALEGEEFSSPRTLPPTDYEEVPREEQEYMPEQYLSDEAAPEEIYESDEEYLE